jgi:hypothetical protein
LEELLFFNPQQNRVRDGILESLEQFGQPRLEDSARGLSVRVGDHEAQTLFACDRDRRSPDPVGLVVFLRTNPSDMSIMHVAVHPDYSLRGRYAGVGLGATLVEKVREIASRIVGIKRIVFFYRQEVVIKL